MRASQTLFSVMYASNRGGSAPKLVLALAQKFPLALALDFLICHPHFGAVERVPRQRVSERVRPCPGAPDHYAARRAEHGPLSPTYR